METGVVRTVLTHVGLPLSDEQRRRLNERVGDLLDRAVLDALGLADPGWLANAPAQRLGAATLAEVSIGDLLGEARRRRPKETALAEVAISEYLLGLLGNIREGAAKTAAESGASYVELGDAIGMTRQGAKRRWPGLADVAAAARRHGRPVADRPAQRDVGRWKISRWEREIQYELTVAAWRVSDLRLALEPVPADAPLMASPAEKPGGEFDGDLQVVTAAYVSSGASPRDPETRAEVPTVVFELDYPSGTYYSDDDQEFEHRADGLTAGEVLAILSGLDGEMPVLVWVAEKPGGAGDGPTQIVYDAAMGAEWSPPGRGESEGEWVTAGWFGLQLEYPPGVYTRYENTHGEEDD
ncbi:DUF6225 family protein [Micromonospora sp. NPDC049662]|uniref:DUF6225 family protein n=1 Tax=Micromonospora sp. NPDC049662 TaxID=3155397 RepID=UPI00342CDAAE